MELRSIYIRNKLGLRSKDTAGFTLIEVLVSVGILSVLAGAGWWVGLDVYSGFMLHSERNQVLSLLHRARSGSLTRAHGGNMGVCVSENNYVLFSGTDCASGVMLSTVGRALSVDISWPHDPVFQALSGRTAATALAFSAHGRTLTITVNSEGRID